MFREMLTENILSERETRFFILATLLEKDLNVLNESSIESITEGIDDTLSKMGLKIHKGKGILDYVSSFVKGSGKVFLAMLKGDTKSAKEILQSVSKEDVLDFLYKLDLGTLHLITGPLHTIDAWTGWDLSVKMKRQMQKAGDIFTEIKATLSSVKQKIVTAFGTKKSAVMVSKLSDIEKYL